MPVKEEKDGSFEIVENEDDLLDDDWLELCLSDLL
jgi:hypothetical protein